MTTYRQSIVSEIGVLLDDAGEALKAARQRLADLDALPGAERAGHKDVTGILKSSDGKLTPAGLKRVFDLFDAGRTRADVARVLEISYPAANNRWKDWKNARAMRQK
jgi:hypothetical protein